MAKYLRPRRGTKTNAVGQNILLKRGEIFLEFPGTTIGNQAGRLIVGDGSTSYSNIKPFIEDPSLYIPRFDESSFSGMSSTEAIDAIGDGSGTVTLPTIIGATKQALKAIADDSKANYNAATSKVSKTDTFTSTKNGLAPQLLANATSVTKYLRADVSWQIPPNDNTTYDRATTDSNGLLIKLQNDTTKYLRASGSWQVPPDTTYGIATINDYGLVPALPANATSVTKYLRSDATWQVPPNDNTTYRILNSPFADSTTAVISEYAANSAFKNLNNNMFKVKTISAQISSVPANGLGSTWSACTMSGYHPVMIMGFNTGSTVLFYVTCQLEVKNNVQGITLAVRNWSSARVGNLKATVLFIRDEV